MVNYMLQSSVSLPSLSPHPFLHTSGKKTVKLLLSRKGLIILTVNSIGKRAESG